jgi:hypothetical protein
MRDKKKKTNIKVSDLKPKKDAKGGVATHVSSNRNVQSHQFQSRQLNQANRQI